MKPPIPIFLCDDQLVTPEHSWIGDLDAVIGRNAGSGEPQYQCEHIATCNARELNSAVLVEYFMEEIRKRADGREFCVVTDARFGQDREGGGTLLARLLKDEQLGAKFLRGLVYSQQPDLGKAAGESKVRALVRPLTRGGVAHQAAVILFYLTKGDLRHLQELQEYCRRIKAALAAWLETREDPAIPTEWNIGDDRLPLFCPETARLLVDLDRFAASKKDFSTFGQDRDLLHGVVCPYQSLRNAAHLQPQLPPDSSSNIGWIRLGYELANQANFARRITELKRDRTWFQQEWIDRQAKLLESRLKEHAAAPAALAANLREGIRLEFKIISSFLNKKLET